MPNIKLIGLNLLTGASVTLMVMMVLVGYSDRLNPVDYPVLACAGMTFPFFLIINAVFLVAWVLIRWRRAWIPLAGFLLAYAPMRTFFPLHLQGEPPQGCIKLISYNVAGYGGNYRYDQAMDTIFSYLRQQDADIVCIQEDMTSKFNPVEQFPSLYPYNDTTLLTSATSEMKNVLGIHTRFPIIRKERIPYTSVNNGTVAYYLNVRGKTVIVINNHLESTHLSSDDRQRYRAMINGDMDGESSEAQSRAIIEKLGDAMTIRAPQAETVHRYIEAHNEYPIIVCGDFNDTPISYTRRTIAQGLTDCYVEAGMGAGISFNQKGFSFRIDHILCSSHFAPYNCKVDNKMDASDHYPVMCWLKMKE
ncbi:MAG: endonuclease/exonuclease/phosphatase family protein [Prevotella sp.]|nr:endonuclease/exonuclease/phosphatase family protein [Prevotella sp.]